MSGSRDGHRQAARDGNAAVESEKLQRDLALIVIHGHHAIVFASTGCDEEGIGGQRAGDVDAGGAHAIDCRGDGGKLLGAEQPSFPGMRVEGGNGDARRADAAGNQGAMEQKSRGANLVDGDQIRHRTQRNMRCDPRSPEAAADVNLRDCARIAEKRREVVQLIFMRQTGELHRLLIQGGVDDRVQGAALQGFDGEAQRAERVFARGCAHPGGRVVASA